MRFFLSFMFCALFVCSGRASDTIQAWWRFEHGTPGAQILQVDDSAGGRNPLYNRIFASAVYSDEVSDKPPAGVSENTGSYRGYGLGAFLETDCDAPIGDADMKEFTIEVSFKISEAGLGKSWVPVLSKIGAPADGNPLPPVVLKITPDNCPFGSRELWFQYLDSAGKLQTMKLGKIVAGMWYHASIVKGSYFAVARVNGKVMDRNIALRGVYPSKDRWLISACCYDKNIDPDGFNGLLDEIRITDRALRDKDLLYP